MRLLYTGDDARRGRPAARQPRPLRGRGARGPVRQPVPLYRVPEHRPRGTRGGRRDAGRRHRPRRHRHSRPRGACRGGVMTVTEVGTARRRKEDQRLITGRTRWTDNITLPGMLHLAMVRSPFAHATITSVDVEAAKASPNVVAVLSGKDFGDELGSCINAWPITPDQKTPTHSPMPADRVAFAGEVVAVVVARSAAEARDAAELVDVEYDELPAVIGIKNALR